MGKGQSELPKGWAWAKLGELANKVVGGGTPNKANNSYFNGDIPFMTVKDMNIERPIDTVDHITAEALEQSSSNLISSDTLIVATRIGLGKVVRVNFQTAINQDLKAIYFDESFVNKDFIEKWYRKSADEIRQLGTGTTVKGIRLEVLNDLNIPFPPLNEQKRIVAKIEELQSHSRRTREALETIPDLLQQLRQSILAAAFRGDLTKKWREQHKGQIEPATELLKRIRIERRKRWEEAELDKLKAKGLTGDQLDAQFAKRCKQYQEPAQVDTSGLPKLPKGWCWATIEQMSIKVVDGVHKKPVYVSEGIPFVTVKNLTAGPKLSLDQLNYISPEDHVVFTRRADPELGDLLVSKDGTLGVIRVVDTAIPFSIFVSVALIKPIDYNTTNWLEIALKAPQGQRNLVATGSGLQHIHLRDLRAAFIPIPPISEMNEIYSEVSRLLNTIIENESYVSDSVAYIQKLEDLILLKAFRGQLVPQDPKNDEPASILLERIHQEKERQAAEGKLRPRPKGKKMKKAKAEPQDMITVLREASRPMTPEELFVAGGFDEESVDSFFEQLRAAIAAKKIREMRRGATIRMEALP